jgi:hypothetical protein
MSNHAVMSNPENPVGRAAVPASLDTTVGGLCAPSMSKPKTTFDGTKLPLVVEPSQDHYRWYELAVPGLRNFHDEVGFSARKNRNLNCA